MEIKIFSFASFFKNSKKPEFDQKALRVIDDEIRAYFASKTSHRALIFSAPWGSGKSTLMREWIKRAQRHRGKHSQITYISAFGVQDGAELLIRIYSEIVSAQNITYKTIDLASRTAYEIIGLSPNAAAQLLLKIAVKPKYIIIDDLERIETDGIKSIFGAINTITEQMRIKTVIICDIEKISLEEHGHYAEKLTKEVIKLNIDKTYAVKNIFLQECEGLPKAYLQTDMFYQAVMQSGVSNLRHIEKAAQTYKRLIDIISSSKFDKLDTFGNFTYGITAYCLENQISALKDDDLNEINRYFGRKDVAERIRHFIETYTLFDITQAYSAPLSSSLVRNIVIDNCANKEAIIEELLSADHYKHKEPEEWKIVWNLTTSPKSKIRTALQEQRSKVKNHMYLDTGIILHVFANELRLSEIGDQTKSYDQIVLDAKKYIDDIRGKKALNIHFEKDETLFISIDMNSYMGFGYPTVQSDIYPYFHEIWEYMKSTFTKQKTETMTATIESLFDNIKENLEAISDILTDSRSSKYREQFLHTLDVKKVASQILTLEADDRYTILVSIGARLYKNVHDRPDEYIWRDELAEFMLLAAESKDAIDKHSITSQVEGLTGYKKTKSSNAHTI